MKSNEPSINTVKISVGTILAVGSFLGALGILFAIAEWSPGEKILVVFVLSVILLILEILDWKQRNKRAAKKKLPRLLSLFVEVQKELRPELKYIYRKEIVFQIFKMALRIVILIIIVATAFNFVVQTIDFALNPPTPTPIPTQTLTLTPFPTLIPEANTLYYLFILDASERMKANFNGSESKWNSIQYSALSHLIYGLPERANYGLIVLGGNLPVSMQTCDDKNEAAVTLGLNTQATLINTIKNLNPSGVASLGEAIKLSRNIFEAKQGNIQRKLFIFLGGGDDCFDDKWTALKYFLKDYKKGISIDVSTEVVILADELIDPDLVAELQDDIKRLGLEGEISLQAPNNEQELQIVIRNIYDQTIVQAYQYEPEAVNAQQTLNVLQTAPVDWETTPLQQTPSILLTQPITDQTHVAATIGPIIVVNQPTTVTSTLIPTRTPTPITPSATLLPTDIPAPSVYLLSYNYLQGGISCQVDITVHVSGSDATGSFHVWNANYGQQGDIYSSRTLPVGTYNNNVVTLGGATPEFYWHKVWFEYNGTSSNVLDLICPNLTPSP